MYGMTTLAFPHPVSYTQGNNPLVKTTEEIKTATYDDKTWAYRTYLIKRFMDAQTVRDTAHPEFNKLSYTQYYEQNEKIAHTLLEEKKNEAEKKLSTGTIESKLNSLLAHINNLNLTPTVYAFDKNNRKLRDLGTAFTDIMDVIGEHDGNDDGGDKEKRLNRQRELLKQGTVFVQETWLTKYEIKKKLKTFYKGEFKNFSGYTEKLTKVYEGCNRDVLYGPNVYLGDITQFSMHDQPYVFTREVMSYDLAKTIYGQFDNWGFVRPGMIPSDATASSTNGQTIYDQKWRLSQLQATQVEVLKYQDQPNDEYCIMINGVMLTPAGFPLSAVTPSGKYNVAKQVLYVVNPQFAYGKSFVSSGAVYELSTALDNMLGLFELKTRKSIDTAYVNITNKVIPAKVLNPGSISMGIPPNALQPIGSAGQGVTASEFQVFQELQNQIEKSTISAVFQGQQAKTGATATEILEVQRQAKLTLGLIIAACTLLEVKIGYLRLWTIIGNWLEPMEDGNYRMVSRETSITRSGTGERRVIPIDGELPDPEVIRILSLQDEQELDMPVRRTYISLKTLREANLLWRIIVEQKEEETSAYETIKFREMIGDTLTLMQMGARPNVDGLSEQLSTIYNKDKSKLFSDAVDPTAGQPPVDNTGGDPAQIAGGMAAGNNMNPAGVAQ